MRCFLQCACFSQLGGLGGGRWWLIITYLKPLAACLGERALLHWSAFLPHASLIIVVTPFLKLLKPLASALLPPVLPHTLLWLPLRQQDRCDPAPLFDQHLGHLSVTITCKIEGHLPSTTDNIGIQPPTSARTMAASVKDPHYAMRLRCHYCR
jgi:hypothetical protein